MKLTYFVLGAMIGGAFIYIALTAGRDAQPEPKPAPPQQQTCTVTGNGTIKYVGCP